MPSLEEVRLIEFPKVHDQRGNLSFIESAVHVPFDIKRVYYLYDIPGGAERAGHAHIELKQILLAIAGSFEVVLTDGTSERAFTLNRSNIGLYVPPGVWRVLTNFSYGSVCLALASEYFKESDYIRDYDVYLNSVKR